MKKLNQKGITLISLIITIIVMLILVGVTVTVALDGGLFRTAKKATTETEIAKEREILQASLGAYDSTVGGVNIVKLREKLPEGWEIEEGENNFICKSPTGIETVVSKNGIIAGSIINNTTKAKAGYKFAYVGLDTWHNANGYGYNMEADEEINITTNPTIPAQIKYKDGTTEDITLYAKGENEHDNNFISRRIYTLYLYKGL